MYAKLNPLKLGLAGGILFGAAIFITTWVSMYTGYAMFWLSQWMDIYPGFDLSIKGTFIGLLYGFVDGFIALFVLGWVYNLFKP